MPIALAAFDCPGSTEEIPTAVISAMYAASFSDSPSRAAASGVISDVGRADTERRTAQRDAERDDRIERRDVYQKINCTSSGVPRKTRCSPG